MEVFEDPLHVTFGCLDLPLVYLSYLVSAAPVCEGAELLPQRRRPVLGSVPLADRQMRDFDADLFVAREHA